MASHIYRYKWSGVNIKWINREIDQQFPAFASDPSVPSTIDITADDSTKDDLDLAMEWQGWAYESTDP